MLIYYYDFITASKVESLACVYHLSVLCSCYVHTITVTYISLPIVLFGVLTAGLIIMMPFDQLLLPGLAACKV